MILPFSHLKSDSLYIEKLLLLKLSCFPFNEILKDEINELSKLVKDWDKFFYMVKINSVGILCNRNINILQDDKIVEQAKLYFEKEILRIKYKNTLKLHIMKEVLEVLKNKHIDFIMLKGFQFIMRYYGVCDVRDIGDIDLLMRKGDCQRATALFRELPYDEIKMPYVHHTMFFSKKFKIQIEFHNDIISPPHCFKYDLDDFFTNTIIYKDEDFEFEVLNDLYELYLILLSTLFSHSFMPFRGRNIIDLYALLNKLNQMNKWEEIINKTKQIGCFNYLIVSVKLCEDLFNYKIPDIFKQYFNRKKFQNKYELFTSFLFHYIEYYQDKKHRKNVALMQIQLADTKMDSLKLFYHYIFLPKDYIRYSREKLKVPLFIFYLLRFVMLPYQFFYKSGYSIWINLKRRIKRK